MRSSGFLHRCRMVGVALMAGALPLVMGLSTPAFASTRASTSHHTWEVTVGVQTSNGFISGMIFTPSEIFVKRGDTILWNVGAQEIHTVAFGEPPADTDNESAEGIPDPLDATFEDVIEQFATPAGGHSFTGSGFYNSGVMTTVPEASGFPQAIKRYWLTINAPVGTYNFYCLVHGPMMSQVVHVIPNGAEYPFTQAQYNAQASQQRAAVFAQGFAAASQTERNLPPHTVYAGASVDTGQSDVMRFIRGNTTIRAGQSVTFINVTPDPHTVTIGEEQGTLLPYGNFHNVRLGQNVSSGLFGAAFTGFGLPTSVTFTFTQPGVYHFFCMFHDYEGMVGTITVTD